MKISFFAVLQSALITRAENLLSMPVLGKENLLEFRPMKSIEPIPENGLLLSSPVIMELIQAVHEKGASFRFQARGFSMTPAIRDGDVITISPLHGIEPRRGDVVAFRHPERPQLLVHRVLRRKGEGFLIKGDHCPNSDGWIPSTNLLGVITQVERNGYTQLWPNRKSDWGRLYFFMYALWLQLRRFLVRGYCLFKTKI